MTSSTTRYAAVLLWLGAGCATGPEPVQDVALSADATTGETIARLARVSEVGVAFETVRRCQLEMSAGETPETRRWAPTDSHLLIGSRLTVLDRRMHRDPATQVEDYILLQLRDESGATFWLRNTPAPSAAELAARWRCVADLELLESGAPKLGAAQVRLTNQAPQCPYITPILGSREDLFWGTYDVVGTGLFAGPVLPNAQMLAGETGVAVGVRLQANDGRRRLTVSSEVFDQCFVAAPTAKGADAELLEGWLADVVPDPAAMPEVPVTGALAATGVDLSACAAGAAVIGSCAASVLDFVSVPGPGPFGPAHVQVTRRRVRDRWFVSGGRVLATPPPPKRVVGVKLEGLRANDPVAEAIATRLAAPSTDTFFQLIDPSVSEAAQPTHVVVVNIDYRMPRPRKGTEVVIRRGPGSRVNPAHRSAALRVRDLDAARPGVELEAQYSLLTTGRPATAYVEHFEGLVEGAKSALATTPDRLNEDAISVERSSVPTTARRGSAKVRLQLAAAVDGAAALRSADVELAFGKSAPAAGGGSVSVPDVADDLASSVLALVRRHVDVQLLERATGAKVPNVEGLRAWAALRAWESADGRPMSLLSDMLEDRDAALELDEAFYGVTLPPDASNRCFTFVAGHPDAQTPIAVEFGYLRGEERAFVALASDVQGKSPAAFEVCGVAGGEYRIKLGATEPTVVSLFDTTPNAHAVESIAAAFTGAPRTGAPGQALSLDGGGARQ